MSKLITTDYAREQRRLHKNERYGRASLKWAPMVSTQILAHDPRTILDYGAGKGNLAIGLGPTILDGRMLVEYDPGVKRIATLPAGEFDMVCCIDVLEHIEPECLDSVLDALRDKTGGIAFLTIHTGPAGKFLSDGRNAHLIQKPITWWRKRLEKRFTVTGTGSVNRTHWLTCTRNPTP